MTEQECIGKLNILNDALNENFVNADECSCALQMGIEALEEIQQYRVLGTVEELRVARDKQVEELCEWEYDEFEEKWQTDCDVLFTIHDSDREITKYCPCCGKEIKVRCEDDD